MPRYFLDVVDGGEVIPDPDGLDFADLETALAEAAQGARDLVAHALMQNRDVSGQSFVIRDERGATIATLPFRAALPGRLGDRRRTDRRERR